MSWFESDNKKEYQRTKIAAQEQEELFRKELAEVEEDHNRRIRSIEERIDKTSTAHELADRKHQRDIQKKEREIENEIKEYAEKIDELEQAFSASKAEFQDESQEKLQELQREIKNKKNELMSAHKKAVAEKREELTEMKDDHRADMANIEKKQNRIVEERKERLDQHKETMTKIRAEQDQKLEIERQKLEELQRKNAEQEKKAMEEENKREADMQQALLEQFAANLNLKQERELTSEVFSMLRLYSRTMDAGSQLVESLESLRADTETGEQYVQNHNNDWSAANEITSSAIMKLVRIFNAYSSVRQEFMEQIKKAVNEIDKNIGESKTLNHRIKAALTSGNIGYVESLLPYVKSQLNTSKALEANTRQACTLQDNTVPMIHGAQSHFSGRMELRDDPGRGSNNTIATEEEENNQS